MPTISLTFTQLYTGFVGLREDEILTRHPLGKHLHYLGTVVKYPITTQWVD